MIDDESVKLDLLSLSSRRFSCLMMDEWTRKVTHTKFSRLVNLGGGEIKFPRVLMNIAQTGEDSRMSTILDNRTTFKAD